MGKQITNILEELENDAIIKQFERAKEKVQDNIADETTSGKETRKIIITVSFSPTDDRQKIIVEASTKVCLAKPKGTSKVLYLSTDDYGNLAFFDSSPSQSELFIRKRTTLKSKTIEYEIETIDEFTQAQLDTPKQKSNAKNNAGVPKEPTQDTNIATYLGKVSDNITPIQVGFEDTSIGFGEATSVSVSDFGENEYFTWANEDTTLSDGTNQC